MPRRWLLALALVSAPASALESVTIRGGFNFRSQNRLLAEDGSSTRLRTIRKATAAALIETRGDWRKVCVGGRGKACRGGELGWVYYRGIKKIDSDPYGGQEANTQCFDGVSCKRTALKTPVEVVEPLAIDLTENPTGYRLPKAFAPNCSKFIGPKGWGVWGRHLNRAVNKVAPTCLYENKLFNELCPNYLRLSKREKNAFIALVGASMGQVESTCRDGPPEVRGMYGSIAVGMFQMEKQVSSRARAGRDRRWCRTDRVIDTEDPVFQTECTVSIIEDHVCKKNRDMTDRRGYWEKLKYNRYLARLIRSTAISWGLCGD